MSFTDPRTLDTVMLAPGHRVDAVFRAAAEGTWAFHCHILTHAESPHGRLGKVTAVVVT